MEEPVSKSQKKREAHALQELGVALTALKIEQLALLPLPDPLRDAILSAKQLKSFGAIKRQAQFIGKLMRASDHEAIAEAYQILKDKEGTDNAEFHQIEQWRARLLEPGNEALTELLSLYPDIDDQNLRQLIRKAQSNKPGASKALFRFLRIYLK